MQSVAIFDDGRGLLSPLTDLRACFDIRTGALTTLERLALHARRHDLPQPDALFVPEALADLTREKHPTLGVNDPAALAAGLLLVNGSCPLNDTDSTGVELGEAIVDSASGTIIKAHIRTDRAAIHRILAGDASGLKVHAASNVPTLSRPWHIRAHRDACIAADLAALADAFSSTPPPPHSSIPRLHIAASAIIHPSVIFDTEPGPIVIADHAIIRPGAIIVGPAYIGPNSSVLERSLIKSNTAIGPCCKVAGEIGGTIFQGYANKSHDGHLGDSYIGEWANLGAGTTNSNLLNTYGDIICRPLGESLGGPPLRGGPQNPEPPQSGGPPSEHTGQQFLGATIGDHVKTAICTRIMTGAIVGTGTMFAASTPLSGTIPPLSWITDSGTKPFAADKFVQVARTVMARRKIAMSNTYLGRLRELAGSR